MSSLEPLEFTPQSRIFVLTGAGVSAASGLATFRGPLGQVDVAAMWASDAVNLLASLPQLWALYGGLRASALAVDPNPAHLALADLERRLPPGARLTLATQNVDGLHQRAGSQRVLELHGSALRSRCTSPTCPSRPFDDSQTVTDPLPRCAVCGAPLRPDIVLFNEALPFDVLQAAGVALESCDLFLAVGTSGVVAPAAGFVRVAAAHGARTLLVNRDPLAQPNPYFQETYYGPAEKILPRLLGGDR
jgi:NAD-dependent deacetylase